MTTDVAVTLNENGIYDWTIDENGDFTNGDFFDSSLLYSIYGERRALSSEMPASHLRRGWIGNEFADYENGSKLWLYEQAKLTRTVMNSVESETVTALQWLIDDGFVIDLEASAVFLDNGVGVTVLIQRPSSVVENRYFELWNNTGVN